MSCSYYHGQGHKQPSTYSVSPLAPSTRLVTLKGEDSKNHEKCLATNSVSASSVFASSNNIIKVNILKPSLHNKTELLFRPESARRRAEWKTDVRNAFIRGWSVLRPQPLAEKTYPTIFPNAWSTRCTDACCAYFWEIDREIRGRVFSGLFPLKGRWEMENEWCGNSRRKDTWGKNGKQKEKWLTEKRHEKRNGKTDDLRVAKRKIRKRKQLNA